jgi:hypothetical protein
MAPAASADSFVDTTPGTKAFAVPAGVSSLSLSVTGGAGGDVADGSGTTLVAGGRGALVTGTVAVFAGEQLQLTVAASGGNANANTGTNGAGGAPDGGVGGWSAGGGGGATRVLDCQGVICPVAVIAAGGGGAGMSGSIPVTHQTLPGGPGGDAGARGTDGTSGTPFSGGSGGQPGTSGAAGPFNLHVGGGGGGGSGGGVAVAAVSRETLSPRAFPAAPSGPSALAAKRRYGTKVGYTLNEAASVRFTVVQPQTGRKAKGGRCVKPTRANRKARRCTRLVALRGSFTRAGSAGANSFRFTGRLAGHKLKPGKYRLVATPSAGAKTGRAASASFQIIN